MARLDLNTLPRVRSDTWRRVQLPTDSYRVAKDFGVAAPTINEVVRRRRAITAEMALRLSRYFGTSAQLWQNLQTQYDLEIANKRIGKAESGQEPPVAHRSLCARKRPSTAE